MPEFCNTLPKAPPAPVMMTIARSTRCGIEVGRATMQSLPCVFQYPLYKQQAQRLVRKLARVQVEARIEPWPGHA